MYTTTLKMRLDVACTPSGGVSISAWLGTKPCLRADFEIQTWSSTFSGAFHLSKNAERREGQWVICEVISKVLRDLLAKDAQRNLPGHPGVCLGLRAFDIVSLEVLGKPLNCRVDFAVQHAARLVSSHNSAILQRRNALWVTLGSRILSDSGPHARPRSLPRLVVPRPLPDTPTRSSPLTQTLTLTPSGSGFGIQLGQSLGEVECSICMEDVAATRPVTCCMGKSMCETCVSRLTFHAVDGSPRCPWCRH